MQLPTLTDEDRDIALWIADGHPASRIAEWLKVSVRTAKYRMASVRASIRAQAGQSIQPIKGEPIRRVGNLSDFPQAF